MVQLMNTIHSMLNIKAEMTQSRTIINNATSRPSMAYVRLNSRVAHVLWTTLWRRSSPWLGKLALRRCWVACSAYSVADLWLNRLKFLAAIASACVATAACWQGQLQTRTLVYIIAITLLAPDHAIVNKYVYDQCKRCNLEVNTEEVYKEIVNILALYCIHP